MSVTREAMKVKVDKAEAEVAIWVCKSAMENGNLTFYVASLPEDQHPILANLNWFDKKRQSDIIKTLIDEACKELNTSPLPKKVLGAIIYAQIHNKNISSTPLYEGYLRSGERYESICIRYKEQFYWLHSGAKKAFLWLRGRLETEISIRRKELLAERMQESLKSLNEVATQPTFLAAFKSYRERNSASPANSCSPAVFWVEQCQSDTALGVRIEQIVTEVRAGRYQF